MRRLWPVALCGLIWCQLLGGARADLAPPGQQACLGKATGDACDGGVCSAHTCSKLDYTHWDRDAEVAPPTVSYDCVLCAPSAGQGGGGSASKAGTGGAAQGGSGGSAQTAGGAAQGGSGGSAQTAGGAAQGTGDQSSGCGSCSAGGTELGLRSAALSFALFMGLWLGGRLRRKPR